MHRSLTALTMQFLTNRATFKSSLKNPVLVWKEPVKSSGEIWQGTHSGAGQSRPTEGGAVVFDVAKTAGKQNAFAMGVTIGRIDTNDIALDDDSVSRFHAWMAQDPKAGWRVCDADSKNGTFVDGQRLKPNEKAPVKSNTRLKFGEVEVTFLEVDALVKLMEELMNR
jgi:hypothetical protein